MTPAFSWAAVTLVALLGELPRGVGDDFGLVAVECCRDDVTSPGAGVDVPFIPKPRAAIRASAAPGRGASESGARAHPLPGMLERLRHLGVGLHHRAQPPRPFQEGDPVMLDL